MKRRNFLAASSAFVGSGLSGCLGSDDSTAENVTLDPDKEQHSIGDTIEYGGLAVTIGDPVLADHYAPYDCSAGTLFERDDSQECSPPEIDDFEESPTQGGQFLAVQITVEHVGERRITPPSEESGFDLVTDGYLEDKFLIDTPWVSAMEVFPSYLWFIEQHEMGEIGVFPGVAVRGYIAFEVPIQADNDDFTAVMSWAGNEDQQEEVYWDITDDDVEDLTEAEAPVMGGDVFYEPRAGGVNWGEDGHPDQERGEGINWEFDGDGEYHVPQGEDDSDE